MVPCGVKMKEVRVIAIRENTIDKIVDFLPHILAVGKFMQYP